MVSRFCWSSVAVAAVRLGFLPLVVRQLASLFFGLAAKLLGLVAQLVLRIAHAITSHDPGRVPDAVGSNPCLARASCASRAAPPVIEL
jgi:hypothetical protein